MPSVGVLLGARSYEATMPFFPFGRRILIELKEKMQDPVGFGAFLGTLRDEAGRTLASSTIEVLTTVQPLEGELHPSRVAGWVSRKPIWGYPPLE